MEKNINANQARTFLLLTAQINSKTSSEMQRKFDAIEISFQNPTESGYQLRRGSERHSFDSGNLTIKQIDINETISQNVTNFTLKKTDISYRKIKETEQKKEILIKKASKLIKCLTYLKELADKLIKNKRRKQTKKRGNTLKIKKSKTLNTKILNEKRSQIIKKNSNLDNMIKFDIDNNVKERKYNSNKTLISILPKIRESHNQINHFFVKDTYKTNVNKKSFQFCLKPKLL